MAQLGEWSSSSGIESDIYPQSGLLALGSNNGHLAITRLDNNWNNIQQFGRDQIKRVRFSLGGEHILASVEKHLAVLPVDNLEQVIQLYEGHTDLIEDFCLLGHHNVYTCSNQSIILWDLRSPCSYHTFTPRGNTLCIDILPTENVLLTGDMEGYLSSWNLRTLTNESAHVPPSEKQSSITTVAVSPDSSWICAGSKGADLYAYKYLDKHFVLQHALPGTEEMIEMVCGVAECTFPRANSESAAVAFTDYIALYDPNDKELDWSTGIFDVSDNADMLCCTTNDDGTVIYVGNSCGQVASCGVETEVDEILPLKIGGEITTLDFMNL